MSQEDTQTQTIDGHAYKIRMLDPLVASVVFVDLMKVFGPALGAVGQSLIKSGNTKEALAQLMDGGADGDGISDLLGDSLERALLGMVDRIENSKLNEIIGIMRGATSVEVSPGKWPELEPIFSEHFRGKVFSMYKWLAFAVRAQYRVFP